MKVIVKRVYRKQPRPSSRPNDLRYIGQWETALCCIGTKFVNCVVVDHPVRVWTMGKGDLDALQTPLFKGKPYPAKRMAKKLLEIAKTNGITKAAKKLVRAVLDGTALPADEVDAKPSENQDAEFEPGTSYLNPSASRRTTRKAAAKPDAEAKPAKKKTDGPAHGSLVRTIAERFKLDAAEARKLLRQAGMKAPYTDEKKIVATLEKAHGNA